LIFVAVFVGWALYLIPKFMRDHEELATTRSLQDFSARLRVFAATRTVAKQNLLSPDEPTVEISMDEIQEALRTQAPAKAIKLPTRAAAKKAAKRRRRVLLVLLTLTAIVSGLAIAGIGPVWTPAIPATFVLLFMMIARRSVRRAAKARRAAKRAARFVDRVPERSEGVSRSEAPAPAPIVTHETDVEVALIASIEADNAADTDAAAAADRLWDPVPVTLPTYLDKPAARRTVMSIELNRGIVSSGHDEADSELVRAAEAAAAEETPVDLEAPRRAAGA
jgi:hypothetical protein